MLIEWRRQWGATVLGDNKRLNNCSAGIDLWRWECELIGWCWQCRWQHTKAWIWAWIWRRDGRGGRASRMKQGFEMGGCEKSPWKLTGKSWEMATGWWVDDRQVAGREPQHEEIVLLVMKQWWTEGECERKMVGECWIECSISWEINIVTVSNKRRWLGVT